MKLCDLHTHSVYSDGSWTPAQLLDEAEKLGLGAIALTDHNTVAGLPDFMAQARGRQVEAVPGIEFSSDYRGKDIHILGLYVREEHYDAITALLAQAQARKEESNLELIENLGRAGYKLDYENIKKTTRGAQFNRAHVAAELMRLGYVASREEAFERLLDPKRGYYYPPKRMTSFETIEFIRSIGAVAVLAHPLLTFTPEELTEFLQGAVRAGLDGMETVYSTYDEQTSCLACRIADTFGLRHSGGSDFHGSNKPDIRLGSGRGNLAVPLELLEGLKNCGSVGEG